MPEPESENLLLHLFGIQKGLHWSSFYPEPSTFDGIYELEFLGTDTWYLDLGTKTFSVTMFGASYLLVITLVGFFTSVIFSGNKPSAEGTWENNRPWESEYVDGTAVTKIGSMANPVAASAGALTLGKNFYEPMPDKAAYQTLRFANKKDGTRIYIKKEWDL